MKRLLLIPLLALLFAACDEVLTSQHPYGEEFELQTQQRALIGGESLVKFLGVTEDSRCPSDVDCVWAGNARAELELRVSGYEPVRFSLNTNSQFPTEATINGVHVKLIDVMPYPKSTVRIDPNAYSVRLLLTK